MGVAAASLSLTIGMPASARTPSSTALYRALLRTRVAEPQLPRGYHDPMIGSSTPGRGAVGEVDLVLNGADVVIEYIVFPNRADALADYAHSSNASIDRPPPANFRSLSTRVRFESTRHGTDVALVDQNVEVFVVARSVSYGLTRFAVRHLEETRRSAA